MKPTRLLFKAALFVTLLAGFALALAQGIGDDITQAFGGEEALYYGLVIPLVQVFKRLPVKFFDNEWGVRALSVALGIALAFIGTAVGLTPVDGVLPVLLFGVGAGLTGSGLKDVVKSLLGAIGGKSAPHPEDSTTRTDSSLTQ